MCLKPVLRFIFSIRYIYFSAGVANAQEDSLSSLDDYLNLSLDQLMDVKVVTSTGQLKEAGAAPSTITVITAEQIAHRGYEQLEDALRDIPGIDMIHINGYAPTLYYFRVMYGVENLRALLMIDGIAENNVLGTNDLAGPAYSLHIAERIEIIWGPGSALYGANAYGGIINIISKKGRDIDGLQVQQGFGSFNTSFEKIQVGFRKSKYEFALAGTLYNTDGPKFANRDPEYTNSFVDQAYSLNASLTRHGARNSMTAGFRTYTTPMGWGTFFNSPTVFLGLPNQGYQNSGVLGLLSRNVRNERGGVNKPYLRTLYVQNEYTPSEKVSFNTTFLYSETGTDDDSYAYVTLDGSKLIRAIVTSYSNRIGGQIKSNIVLAKNQYLTAGFEYVRGNVERGSRKATLDTTNNIYLIDGRDTVIGACDILFVPEENHYPVKNILSYMHKGTLSISEVPGFAEEGIALNLVIVEDKLKIEANVNSLFREGLKASAQLLRLARIVN